MKVSIQFSLLLMVYSILVGVLTKPLAWTPQGFGYGIALTSSLFLAYYLGGKK